MVKKVIALICTGFSMCLFLLCLLHSQQIFLPPKVIHYNVSLEDSTSTFMIDSNLLKDLNSVDFSINSPNSVVSIGVLQKNDALSWAGTTPITVVNEINYFNPLTERIKGNIPDGISKDEYKNKSLTENSDIFAYFSTEKNTATLNWNAGFYAENPGDWVILAESNNDNIDQTNLSFETRRSANMAPNFFLAIALLLAAIILFIIERIAIAEKMNIKHSSGEYIRKRSKKKQNKKENKKDKEENKK